MTDDEIIRIVLNGFYENINSIETLDTLYKIRDKLEEKLKLHESKDLYNFEVNYSIILQDFKQKLDKFLSSFTEFTELTEIEEIKQVIIKLTKISNAINYFNAL